MPITLLSAFGFPGENRWLQKLDRGEKNKEINADLLTRHWFLYCSYKYLGFVHKHACVWWVLAGTCCARLHLHVYEPVCVFQSHKVHVLDGLEPWPHSICGQRGCSKTNDLAPVSQGRRTWLGKKNDWEGKKKGSWKVCPKENLQISFGSGESSSACEQFSWGNDSSNFARVACLTAARGEPWLASGPPWANLPSSQELP